MQISNRAQKTPASPIRKLVPWADKAKKQGVKIYHLNIGQPDIPSPESYLKSLKSFPEKTIAYENSLGSSELRSALNKYYQSVKIKVSPDEIIITTGGSEAILFALLSICDPRDECLVFEPFYANYSGFASMAGVNLKAVPSYPRTGFHLPEKTAIVSKITPRTRALILTNPNNPTGTVYTKKELLSLLEIARRFKLFIISDETYREFVYDHAKHYSLLALSNNPNNIILVDSLSKRLSLCGARLGCLVSKNPKILEAVSKFAQARLASPTVSQYAAAKTLESSTSFIIKLTLEFKSRRDAVINELKTIKGLEVYNPEGAFYCIVGLPLKDAEAFCRWLLTDFRQANATVMLAPASGFYLDKHLGKNQVRLAFVLNSPSLIRAVAILKKALDTYPDKLLK